MTKAALAVPPHLRKFIASQALRTQVQTKLGKQYYSTIRFGFDPVNIPDTSNPNAVVTEYRLSRRLLRAFSYGTQEDAVAAGFNQSFRPTQLETNLLARSDTGGAVVLITGISFHLTATSDMGLAQYVWDNCYADISLDGMNQYMLLGRFDRVPQSGGLYGIGESRVITPGLTASTAQVGSMTNGMPMSSNYLRLPEKIRWNPASRVDSKFQVRFEVVRDIAIRATRRLEGNGIAGFTPPTQAGDRGTYVDLVVYLQTRETAPRSTQQ